MVHHSLKNEVLSLSAATLAFWEGKMKYCLEETIRHLEV